MHSAAVMPLWVRCSIDEEVFGCDNRRLYNGRLGDYPEANQSMVKEIVL